MNNIIDVTNQVRRADLAARQERLTGPNVIQMPGTGHGKVAAANNIRSAQIKMVGTSIYTCKLWDYVDGKWIYEGDPIVSINSIERTGGVVTAYLNSVEASWAERNVLITGVTDLSFNGGPFGIVDANPDDGYITYAQAGNNANSGGGKAEIIMGGTIEVYPILIIGENDLDGDVWPALIADDDISVYLELDGIWTTPIIVDDTTECDT